MIIKRLTLINYRRYRNTKIDFPNGLIGIVGRNGIGKSTLLEAIGWCLYGSKKARTNQNEIITTGVNDKCFVTLELDLNDMSVKIEREINTDGMTNARLFLNNSKKPTVNGSNAVGKYVTNKLIKMDQKSFFNSIFAKQKELSVFSNMVPSERKLMIEKLLGIDMIKKAFENIRNDKKTKNEKMGYILEQIEDIDSLNEQLEKITSKKDQHMQKYDKLKKNIIIANKSKQKIVTSFKKSEKKYKDNNKECLIFGNSKSQKNAESDKLDNIGKNIKYATMANKELSDLAPDIRQYDIISKELKKLDDLYIKYVQLEEKITERNKYILDIEKYNKLLDKTRKKLHEIKNDNKDVKLLKSELNIIEKECSKKNIELEKIKNILDNFQSDDDEQKNEQINIQKLGKQSTCPTCKRPLHDHYDSVLQTIQNKINNIAKETKEYGYKKIKMIDIVNDLEKKIKYTKKALNDINTKISKKDVLKSEFDMTEKSIQDLNTKKINLDKKIDKHEGNNYSKKLHDTSKEKYKTLEKKHERSIEIQNESKKIPALIKEQKICINKLKQIEKKIKKSEQIIKNIGFNELEYENIRNEQEISITKYHELEKNEIRMNGEINDCGNSMKFIQKQISKNNQLQRDYSNIRDDVIKLIILEDIMAKFRLELISRIRPSLSNKTSILLKNMTRGKYNLIKLDNDYNIQINDGGEYFGIDRFSGGEVDLVNLCLRIAISDELAERAGYSTGGFIALDEIFGSQDSERKINILEQLLGLSKQFKQILIITHIEDVREKLPFVLFIKEGSNDDIFVEKQGDPSFVTNNVR